MRYRKTASTVAAGLAALLCFAGAAFGGKQGSSLSLVVLPSGTASLAAETTTGASFGGAITFDVATTQSDRPFVNVRCYQGDSFVYDMWHGFFDDYYTDPVYTLESHVWTEGAATCSARLVDWGRNGRERTLATTNFEVTG